MTRGCGYIVGTDLEACMITNPMHEMIRLRVSLDQKRAMEATARKRGQTLSELLREGAAALANQVVA